MGSNGTAQAESETVRGRAFDPEKLKEEIESRIVNQGPLQGKNIEVIPWQMEMLAAISDHREVALTIARSNGKTTICAAISCSAISPGCELFIPRGQTILTAASMGQARICFEHIVMFMEPVLYETVSVVDEASGEVVNDRVFRRKEWRMVDNSHHMEIQHRPTRTVLRVIGSDPKRAHGLAPTLVIADEPAQWESGGDMHYAALRTSLGKQANPRFLLIGTRPRSPLHFFSRILSQPPPGTRAIVYAATRKDAKDGGAYRLDTIRKANPSYDHLEALRSEIEEFKEGARKQGGMRRAQYEALYLNMGTSESDADEEVIEPSDWETVTELEQPARGGPVSVGVDLGGGNSMTAVAFYWPQTGRLECHGAFPELPDLEQRGQKDGIGLAYQEMHDQGVLHIHGVKETRNGEFLRARFANVTGFEWLGVACDRYKLSSVQQAMIDAGHGNAEYVDRAVGRGSDGWDDLEQFRKAVLEEHLRPGLNLALEHAVMCAIVKRDNNNNASLDKSHSKGKIDVLQAVIHAVGLGERFRRPAEPKREYSKYLYA